MEENFHLKRACRMIASRRFGPYLRRLKSGDLKISLAAVRERERHDGLWVVHSNDHTLSAEDLALAYKQLVRVEEAWRTMKSTIEIRPVFHRTPDRIRAHVFLCVLALLVERVAVDKNWSIVGASRDGVPDDAGEQRCS